MAVAATLLAFAAGLSCGFTLGRVFERLTPGYKQRKKEKPLTK